MTKTNSDLLRRIGDEGGYLMKEAASELLTNKHKLDTPWTFESLWEEAWEELQQSLASQRDSILRSSCSSD